MNSQIQTQTPKTKNVNYLIITLISLILIFIVAASQFIYTVLKYDGFYKGLYIENINVSSMKPGEVEEILKKDYEDKVPTLKLTLNSKNASRTISFSDIDVTYDIQGAINDAYLVGRTGNMFKRLYDIYLTAKAGSNHVIPVSFDKDKLEGIIQEYYDKTFISVKEPDLFINSENVILKTGHHGESIDSKLVLKEVEDLIAKCKGDTLEIPLIITEPKGLDIDQLYNQIVAEPQNALLKVEENKVTIEPHKVGRTIDRSNIEGVVSRLEGRENIEQILPVTFITPEITTEVAQANLFKDTLAVFSTRFNTSNENNKNRGENIRLSSAEINGKILAPGDIFSFNDVVGPRTEHAGYKAAHAYIGGKIVDDVGGGICQVSTTLYNVVLYSDLEVVERRNHMFTVGYVALGSDAAVSYGSPDFKFKNSTRWPLKIEATVSDDNVLTFKLIGTNETPGKEIIISPSVIKTIDFKTKYIDDPTLPEGTTRVKQEGMTGYVVDTYKIIKQNGQTLSQTKIHTSTYSPLDKEVIRGTKKVAPPDAPEAKKQPDADDTQTTSES